jgi:hypothetical protein
LSKLAAMTTRRLGGINLLSLCRLLDFSRKLCHYRDCIKSRAAALANLPHRARW